MEQDAHIVLENQYKEILDLLDQGYNKKEIETRFGISLDNWFKNTEQYPEFSSGVDHLIGKYITKINQIVWKMAQGYEYEEKTVTEKELPNGKVLKTTVTVTRTQHPNLDACREVMKIISEAEYFKEYRERRKHASIAKDLGKATCSNIRHKAPAPKNSAC